MKQLVRLLFFSVLSLAAPSWALTTLYVNTDSTAGGDCTTNNTSGSTRACATLRAAIDLLPGTLSDAYLILVDGTAADTGDVNQGPWDMTTSATNTLTIRANTNSRHNGIWSTSKYRLTCTGKNCLYNNIPSHIRFENFQVECTASSGSFVCVKTSNANQTATDIDARISGMFVRCVETGSGDYIGINTRFPSGGAGGTSRVFNNIVDGCNISYNNDFSTGEYYNNTAVNCVYGFIEDADMKVVNNLANCSNTGFVGSFASGSNYNAESDGNGGPGANHRTSQTFTFVNAGAGDYHLASGDTGAKGFGTSDPSGGIYSDDVDGNARTGTWDIGFDEFLTALLNQYAYRFRDDDGSESAATWLANENTAITRAGSTATRLRMQVDTTAADPATAQLTLQYKRNSESFWQTIPVTSPYAGTLDYTVGLGTDDAQQTTGSNTMALTGTTIGASLDATTDWAAFRWQGVQIPVGATITTSYISAVPSGTGEDEPSVTVYLEDADNPGTFTTTANDIGGRSRTSGASWSSTDLGADGSTYFNTPSLNSLLQAVVNRGGWAPGNALVGIIQGGSTGTRDLTIESFENAGSNPPKLHVEYTVPTAFQMKASANVTASGENTTRQLTIPAGKASGDFDGGRLQDDENPGDTVDVTLDGFREDEWVIEATANAVNGAIYEFRVVTSTGTVLDTYTVTPVWTVSASGTVIRSMMLLGVGQ